MGDAFPFELQHKPPHWRNNGAGSVAPAERRSFLDQDNLMGDGPKPRVIRDEAFAKRLVVACDGNQQVPEYNKGRLSWIKKQLEERFDVQVSMETVRKWFSGEARPRPDKGKLIAELLQVDEAWLMLGRELDLAPRVRKVRNATVDGAVNVIAGFIQMGGGHPAFPDEDDARSKERRVDIFAIIKGARYDIHVALATTQEDGQLEFVIPNTYEELLVIGVVPREGLCIDAIELPTDLISADAQRRGGYLKLELTEQRGEYRSASGLAPKITGFDQRL